jgi:hypothetical protein
MDASELMQRTRAVLGKTKRVLEEILEADDDAVLSATTITLGEEMEPNKPTILESARAKVAELSKTSEQARQRYLNFGKAQRRHALEAKTESIPDFIGRGRLRVSSFLGLVEPPIPEAPLLGSSPPGQRTKEELRGDWIDLANQLRTAQEDLKRVERRVKEWIELQACAAVEQP